jgi:diketogulonate reductase-like aldo/keto reductase
MPEVNWETGEVKKTPQHKVWAEMERMVELGLAKSIGVSNATVP